MAAPVLVVSGPSAGKTTVGQLIAASFERSVHIAIDDFMRWIVNGWIEPWLPESGSQNEVLGVSVSASAMAFARGGYTVVVDGYIFPEGAEGMAQMCRAQGTDVHFVILRPDLATCEARAAQREPGTGRFRSDAALARDLYSRFTELDVYEQNVIDASPTPAEVAQTVLTEFHRGRFVLQA